MSNKFDKHLFRCSSLGHIMAGLTTYKDKYEAALQKKRDLFTKFKKAEDAYNILSNKETQTALNKEIVVANYYEKLENQDLIIAELKTKVNDIDISEGCKTHLMDIYISKEFNRSTRDIKSKYIEKGLIVEEDVITAYSSVKQIFYEKSVVRKDDGNIMGEIDFEDPTIIYDAKGSWDIWTFYRNVKYIDTPESNPYFPNMQGYMKLWEKRKSKIVYALVDTPEHLIEKELKYLAFDFVGGKESYEEACLELRKNLTFSDIPINRRIIEVPIDIDEEYIELIPKVVSSCRNYLNNIKEIYYEVGSTK